MIGSVEGLSCAVRCVLDFQFGETLAFGFFAKVFDLVVESFGFFAWRFGSVQGLSCAVGFGFERPGFDEEVFGEHSELIGGGVCGEQMIMCFLDLGSGSAHVAG